MHPSRAQLRRIAESILEHYESAADIEVGGDHGADLYVLHGVCTQAVRHAQAALTLIDAGFEREATANVRAALEHAVTAQWNLYVPEMRGRLVPGAKQKAAEFYTTAGKYLGSTEFSNKVEEWSKCKGLPKFQQIMERVDPTDIDGGGLLKFSYAVLSQQVHVTSGAVTSYLHLDQDELSLKRSAGDPFAQPTMFALAMAVALSVYVIEDLRDDKTRRDEVDRLAEDVVPCTLEQDIAQVAHARRAR